MAYATAADIASEFKAIEFTSTTQVKDTEIEGTGGFIDQADALIDSMISSRYEVPVTGTISLLLLKFICILLVKARILSILSVKTPQDKTKQDPDGPNLLAQAMEILKGIKKGQIPLIDAVLAGDGSGGMTSFLIDEDVTYDFQVGTNNW